MKREAVISDDGVFRYSLTRVWDPAKPILNAVLLNPSKADAEIDDQTIRRLVSFARKWGYGTLLVTNLYAFRSTDPKKLWTGETDPRGPDNNAHLTLNALKSHGILCAWGRNAHWDRASHVKELLRQCAENRPHPIKLQCLGRNKDGSPKHPLRLNGATKLVEF